jgi:methanogenic corrinoid protein MtbC1
MHRIPDTPRHTIKTVCAQTGILPVTLRAWERRYHLVAPQRTAGNYRLYSDRDIAVLRWVKRRLEDGLTVGRAADEFHRLRQAGRWPTALPAPPTSPTIETADTPAGYGERLYAALVRINEAGAGAVLSEAHARFDLSIVCLDIIQPCLYAVGEAWARGQIRIAVEHFASQYLRGRLVALLHTLPMRHSAPRIVAGCAPDEYHDIGSLMVALFLRREGYRVDFIGANAHLEDLSEYARAERPALICLSAHSEAAARGLRQMDARLAGMRPRPKFGFGGRAFNLKPELRTLVPGLFLGEDARQAVAAVRGLLPI